MPVAMTDQSGAAVVLDLDGLAALVDLLGTGGRDVIGPTVRDGAIVPGPVTGLDDLPAGWGDEQAAGSYRLRRRDDDALFGHAVGPDGPKRRFFEPRTELWHGTVTRDDDGTPVDFDGLPADPAAGARPVALFGLKACELAGIGIQDRVFLDGDHPDPHYAAQRDGAVLVSVDCGDPAATCFCDSMGTGPQADGRGAVGVVPDVRLTELVDGGRHEFVARAGTATGAALLERVAASGAHRSRPAGPDDVRDADAVPAGAVARMGRHLRTDGLAQLLAAAPDHPRWDDVASRCLSCANCTMVCPTCFCSSVEDVTDLTGDHTVRSRRWDSCFTLEHSYLHGGAQHPTTRSRYRQWLTHKLSTWWDQFDTAGCVGCGRCIAWCPAAIDLVEEATVISGRGTGEAAP